MKILFVASECAPFVKTGGLADVVGALPKALALQGVECRIVLPLYPALKELAQTPSAVQDMGDLFGKPARLLAVEAAGLSLFLLDAPHLFDRAGGIYLDGNNHDWSDNPQRFAALSEVAARVATEGFDGWTPDILHAHDWQAALAPWYLRQRGSEMPTILTIHNIAFQGVFDRGLMYDLNLDPAGYSPEGFEYWGNISFLKAGIVASNSVTTVSPTYARELMTQEYGLGFEGVLQARKADMVGILNGIDLDVWDPNTDPMIPETFNSRTLKRKARNKAALETRFGLTPNPDAPVFCVISRLTTQKGLDLLVDALPGLVERGARLALLGNGDFELENRFRQATVDYPGAVGAVIGYDEPLAHLIQAGADAILVPSRFEPCGLTQLYGLRYGTLPVVARTGGLADTVIDANAAAMAANCATGIQFAPNSLEALQQAIDVTCDLFSDAKSWASVVRNAMKHPVGWDASAVAYRNLFDALLAQEG